MTWWRRLLRKGQLEQQLDKELRFHIDEHAADLIAKGIEPAEARRQARLMLGGPEQVKENCRDARGTRWLEDLWQDCRYSLRTLRQKPGFAAVALLTLALGTGATTLMFTVINGVLFAPLPYADPGKLLQLQEQTSWSTPQGSLWAFTNPNFRDCERASRALRMAAFSDGAGTLSKPGEPEYVEGREISSNLFSILGIPLFKGRAFLPEEDQPGAAPVAIIGYGVWQRRFAQNPAAIGMPIFFQGKPYTIVGIAPAGFSLNGDQIDVFTPLGQNTAPYMQNREAHGIQVWARLQADATLAAARTELDLVGRRLAQQYPESNKGRTFIADPLRPDVGDLRPTLWLLLGAVSLVLLIACVNVASLLLARAVSRERELAMRVALGAGRGRLVRQCLTESAVLGLSGGLLGVLPAVMGLRPFVAFWPGNLPRAEEVHVDWRVLLFALAASLASGLLFGLAPALRTRVNTLGVRGTAGSSRRLHSSLVISEMALAVVLLICAGMLGRTLLHLSSLDTGLKLQNVLTARVALSPATLAHPAQIREVWQDILRRAHTVPGLESIAMVDTVPMREGSNPIPYSTTAAAPPKEQQPWVLANSVSADYLKVMGIRLLEGRFLEDRDRLGSESVAVIDKVMARQAFGSQQALGKHLWLDLTGDPVRVVGVVAHVRQWGLAGDDQSQLRAQLYYPFAQVPDKFLRRWSELMSIGVRTSIAPRNVIEPLRHVVQGAGADQVLYEVNTLDQLAHGSLSRQRFLLLLFAVFASLALLLACIGIYGVLAYLTGQRVPEMGVRIALGASAHDVTWLVLRQSLAMIFLGVAAGGAAAFAATGVLQRLVEGMQPTDPLTFFTMALVLVMAALLASYIPARRASRIDPMRALRQD
jgi:predicted permease